MSENRRPDDLAEVMELWESWRADNASLSTSRPSATECELILSIELSGGERRRIVVPLYGAEVLGVRSSVQDPGVATLHSLGELESLDAAFFSPAGSGYCPVCLDGAGIVVDVESHDEDPFCFGLQFLVVEGQAFKGQSFTKGRQ